MFPCDSTFYKKKLVRKITYRTPKIQCHALFLLYFIFISVLFEMHSISIHSTTKKNQKHVWLRLLRFSSFFLCVSLSYRWDWMRIRIIICFYGKSSPIRNSVLYQVQYYTPQNIISRLRHTYTWYISKECNTFPFVNV